MTQQPNAPDWRRLVSDAGAPDAEIRLGVRTSSFAPCEIHSSGVYVTIVQPSGTGLWRALINGNRSRGLVQTADPREAIDAAIDYLRAELRARMERDREALRRLGGAP